MNKLKIFATLSIAVLLQTANAFAQDNTVQQKGMWDKTKDVASDVWDGTKEVSSDVWDGTKKVTSDVWNGTKEVGSDIKDGLTGDDDKHQKMHKDISKQHN